VTADVENMTPDVGLDAGAVVADEGVVDAGPDGSTLDGFMGTDAVPGPIDLSGVYAVRHVVRLTSSAAFGVGDEAHTIVTLAFLRGSVYRMQVSDQQGTELFVVNELDFASPDPGTYQFQYPLDDPDPPEGCTHVDQRFQRGTFSRDAPFSLDGDEDLTIDFGGEDCAEEDAIVQLGVEWRPIAQP
jgi:hypothetical protein